LYDSKIVESEEISPGIVLDFNADNQVVGVEILLLSRRNPCCGNGETGVQGQVTG